jgi:glucose/arabinose dehydrogenase
LEKPFLDLRGKLTNKVDFDERGLLGLALHPRFQETKRFYVYYSAPRRASAPADWDHTSHVSEFKVSQNNPLEADPASERIILQIDEPFFNHNSGRMAFGPNDGFLYIATGDGGNSNDQGKRPPQGNAQNRDTLLGKILRIDVNKGNPYGIPTDNPFADGKNGRPEIFAYGLRNPWGISFDRGGTHQLFAAEVGQTRFEEINIIVKGGNYGWNIREALECFNPKDPQKPLQDCPKVGALGEPLIEPIAAYKNANGFRNDPEALGTSITGGYVYRGKALPQLNGQYIFADWSRNFVVAMGTVLVAKPPGSGNGKWTIEPLDLATHPKGALKAFAVALGEDADGELYIMTNASNGLRGKTGKIHKLVAQ